MSATDPAQAPTQPETRADYIGQAIAALTAAARTTRTIGAGTDTEHSEPADFGEIACHVITSVAANLGGVDTLLAGRLGSWEADYVRQIVHSTTPEDELLTWRTEPVRLHLDVEGVFYDFGLEQMWDEESGQAIKLEQDDSLTEEQTARADAIAAKIGRLWEQDQAAYREAYLASIRQELTRRGLTVEVEAIDEPADTLTWEPFTNELARKNTPLSMTGEAPDWTEGTPADALRRGWSDLHRPRAGRHLITLKTEIFEERNNERSRSCRRSDHRSSRMGNDRRNRRSYACEAANRFEMEQRIWA